MSFWAGPSAPPLAFYCTFRLYHFAGENILRASPGRSHKREKDSNYEDDGAPWGDSERTRGCRAGVGSSWKERVRHAGYLCALTVQNAFGPGCSSSEKPLTVPRFSLLLLTPAAELGECELPEHSPELVSEFRFIPNQTEAMEFDIFQRWKECRYLVAFVLRYGSMCPIPSPTVKLQPQRFTSPPGSGPVSPEAHTASLSLPRCTVRTEAYPCL